VFDAGREWHGAARPAVRERTFTWPETEGSMIKMKGQGAIVLTFDKQTYRPQYGILELPEHLERHAILHGFRRLTAAELEELQAEPSTPAAVIADVPGDHPQGEQQALAAAKLDEKITEAAANNPAIAAGQRALAGADA
jgi:hypothetical protein